MACSWRHLAPLVGGVEQAHRSSADAPAPITASPRGTIVGLNNAWLATRPDARLDEGIARAHRQELAGHGDADTACLLIAPQ
jgi:hypothetical protein